MISLAAVTIAGVIGCICFGVCVCVCGCRFLFGLLPFATPAFCVACVGVSVHTCADKERSGSFLAACNAEWIDMGEIYVEDCPA